MKGHKVTMQFWGSNYWKTEAYISDINTKSHKHDFLKQINTFPLNVTAGRQNLPITTEPAHLVDSLGHYLKN